jgi:preprotein translocase subunit SecE
MAEEKETKKLKKAKDSKKASKKADGKKSKKNPFKSIAGFFKSVKSEGKKVVWPTGKEVWKNTLVVLVVILILGVAIYAVDFGLSQGLKGIKTLADSNTTTTTTTEEATTEATTTEDETVADTSEATTTTAAE